MNITKFRIPINQLIFALFFTSGFPGIIYHSVLFESLALSSKFNLYVGCIVIREFFVFLLGIKITLILIKKFNSYYFKYRTLIAFLPLIPIILLVLFDFNIVLLATGIRFYILFSLPLMVFEDEENINFKKNIIINDFIFYFYLIVNVLTLLIGHADFSRIGYGDTFLGVRYPFIFENPIPAAQQFGVFIVYLNFRIMIEKSLFEKTKLLTVSYLVLLLSFYTGGRAGIVIGMIGTISTTITYFFPKIKFLFLTPKKIENKIFTISTLFSFALIALLIASNPMISGRRKTMQLINRQGLIRGTGGNRGIILKNYLNERKLEDILIGKPGKGTNTACIIDWKSEECQKTDSVFTSSIFSFGLIGILFISVTLIKIINVSYSPLMALTFIVYSSSQIFPELILPWTQFVLILFHSNQIFRKNNK